jgi:hypothetical protein
VYSASEQRVAGLDPLWVSLLCPEFKDANAEKRTSRAGPLLIPFPTLSMMLRSGPPDAGAAALWITRRKKLAQLCTNCRMCRRPAWCAISYWRPSTSRRRRPGRSYGPSSRCARRSCGDHRAATRRLFRSLREHRPRGRLASRTEDSVSGRLATGRWPGPLTARPEVLS